MRQDARDRLGSYLFFIRHDKRTITLDTARTGAMAHTTTQVTSHMPRLYKNRSAGLNQQNHPESHNRRGGACTSDSFAGSVCTTTTHESRRCTGHGIHTSVPRHATRPNCAKMCAHARRNNRPTRKHNLRPRPPQRRIGFRARCQARVTQAPHRRPPRSQQHMITPWKTREQSIATQAHGRALTPLTS